MYKYCTGPQLLGAVENIKKCNDLLHGCVGFSRSTKVFEEWAGYCSYGSLQWHWNAVS